MKPVVPPYSLILLVLALSVACRPELAEPTGDPNLLFSDDFVAGSGGSWFTETDQQGATSISDEEMVIAINEANTMQFTTLREPTFGDFDLEVDATLLDGNLESSYGVLFRMQSPEEFYRFEIMGDGRYMIERLNADGSWTRYLDDWLMSPLIFAGQGVTNRLRILARGSQLSFYVNGELLHSLSDGTYGAGNIALDAGTFGQPGLQVSFDNLVIRRP